MNYNFQYSFSDEVASKYDCDYLNKQLEIYFSGFTDLFNNKYYESHCKFIIREWEKYPVWYERSYRQYGAKYSRYKKSL